jgi:hypothetical protein
MCQVAAPLLSTLTFLLNSVPPCVFALITFDIFTNKSVNNWSLGKQECQFLELAPSIKHCVALYILDIAQ